MPRRAGATDLPLARITPRERDVLSLMAQGRSNAGIALALTLSRSAVAKHINSIFTKLAIPPEERDNRRVLAVLAYLDSRGSGRSRLAVGRARRCCGARRVSSHR